MKKNLRSFVCLAACLLPLTSVSAAPASAPAYEGMARPWQLNFQPPATPVMERLYDMHTFLLYIISIITALVLVLLIVICLRFNRRANPVPSKTTHNTTLEIAWTAIPVLILVAIAIPSLRLHYFMQKVVNPDLTVKVVGYQWYWHYDYPDQGNFGFDSYIKKGADLKPGDHRQLAVDNQLVVPVDATVRVLITGADVIHSFAVPSFGVKRDAVPGRLNESWFKATKIGTYYGQCSQLCGVGHGFMPIVVNVVSKEDFANWVKQKQQAGGITPAAAPATAGTTVAVPDKALPPGDNHPAPQVQEPAAKPAPLLQPQTNTNNTKPQTTGDKSTLKPEAASPAADKAAADKNTGKDVAPEEKK